MWRVSANGGGDVTAGGETTAGGGKSAPAGGSGSGSILEKFLNKAFFCVAEQQTALAAPMARMMAGLASGLSEQARDLALSRLKDPNSVPGLAHQIPPDVFRLEKMFEDVEEEAMNLGAQPIEMGYRSGRAVEGTVLDEEFNYLNAAGRRLQEDTAERLTATIDMAAALALSSGFAALCADQGLRPVERLFCLLSTPVPGSLKAAILHCLAALASQGQDTRMLIWRTMEEYRLLEVVHVPSDEDGGTGGAFNRNRQSVKLDLENERREGYYPVTDGFLALLTALLAHDWDVLDDLHSGVRLPGVVPYVEFVLKCVLLEYEDFHGNPDNDAHVWRLVARCEEVLGECVRHYRLTELPLDSSWLRFHMESLSSGAKSAGAIAMEHAAMGGTYGGTGAASASAVADYSLSLYSGSCGGSGGGGGIGAGALASYGGRASQLPQHPAGQNTEQLYASDFGEEEYSYDLPGSAVAHMRPRSAGFTVMSYLLGQDSLLLELLLRLLYDEGNAEHVAAAGTSHLDWICDLSTALLNSPKLLYSKRGLPRHSQGNINNFNYATQGASYSNITCDRAYWRQRAVTAATALLYEASMRATPLMEVSRCFPRLSYLWYDMEASDLPMLPTKRTLILRDLTELVSTCQALEKSLTTNVPCSPLSIFGAFIGQVCCGMVLYVVVASARTCSATGP